jgi:geranylgeranylglycerol-phosphate geranylgeranyltransferase
VNIPATLRLIRFGNCLMVAAAVWVGAYLTVGFHGSIELVVSMSGAFLICAGGNVVNDIIDRDADRINHPSRPLPSGELTISAARMVALSCHAFALIPVILSNRPVMTLGLATMSALFAYNLWLKRLPLIGNLLIGILGGMAFLCGGLSVDPEHALELPGPLVASAFAIMFHLIREIVKDVEDIDGDRLQQIRSLGRLAGARPALIVALLLFVMFIILTIVPAWYGWYGDRYLVIVLFMIDLPLFVLLTLTCVNPKRQFVQWSRAGLKIGMVLGLVALLAG